MAIPVKGDAVYIRRFLRQPVDYGAAEIDAPLRAAGHPQETLAGAKGETVPNRLLRLVDRDRGGLESLLHMLDVNYIMLDV